MKIIRIKKPGKKPKKSKTKAEISYHEKIGLIPCLVCGKLPVQIHHIRESGEPRNHFKSIPLCYDHHQGKNGIHHLGKSEFRKRFGHELDMLKKLNLANYGKNNYS